MLDLVDALRDKKLQIEREYAATNGVSSTARSIASQFGYEYGGIGETAELENKYVLFLTRQTSADEGKYNALLRKLQNDGYELARLNLSFLQGGYRDCDLLLDKKYEDRGNVGVMERQDPPRKAVAALLYDGNRPLIGVFLETSPEHVGILQELAISLGMDTSKASEVPKAFRDLIRELDI